MGRQRSLRPVMVHARTSSTHSRRSSSGITVSTNLNHACGVASTGIAAAECRCGVLRSIAAGVNTVAEASMSHGTPPAQITNGSASSVSTSTESGFPVLRDSSNAALSELPMAPEPAELPSLPYQMARNFWATSSESASPFRLHLPASAAIPFQRASLDGSNRQRGVPRNSQAPVSRA